MLKKIISNLLEKLLRNIVNKNLEKNNYLIIFRNGSAIGDHVYMSSVIREIYIKTNKKILLFTNYFDLYLNNSRNFFSKIYLIS